LGDIVFVDLRVETRTVHELDLLDDKEAVVVQVDDLAEHPQFAQFHQVALLPEHFVHDLQQGAVGHPVEAQLGAHDGLDQIVELSLLVTRNLFFETIYDIILRLVVHVELAIEQIEQFLEFKRFFVFNLQPKLLKLVGDIVALVGVLNGVLPHLVADVDGPEGSDQKVEHDALPALLVGYGP